jgi:hypothetical protein
MLIRSCWDEEAIQLLMPREFFGMLIKLQPFKHETYILYDDLDA